MKNADEACHIENHIKQERRLPKAGIKKLRAVYFPRNLKGSESPAVPLAGGRRLPEVFAASFDCGHAGLPMRELGAGQLVHEVPHAACETEFDKGRRRASRKIWRRETIARDY